MEEYEYSFKVSDIKPYIEYCENNNYKRESEVTQNRIVYENKHSNDIIARITTKITNGKKNTIFDCKNVNKKDRDLKVSSESEPIKVTKSNEKSIYSMLEVLDFYEAANNYRTRYVYKKDNVTFEIDDYIEPKMQVIGIEGKKEEVDKVYSELSKLIHE